MFGDYTLSQASEVIDTTEEVILKVVAEIYSCSPSILALWSFAI